MHISFKLIIVSTTLVNYFTLVYKIAFKHQTGLCRISIKISCDLWTLLVPLEISVIILTTII